MPAFTFPCGTLACPATNLPVARYPFAGFGRLAWFFSVICLLGPATLSLGQTLSATMAFPEYYSSFISGTTINIVATATTPVGTTITKIEFFTSAGFNGVFSKIGEATTSPYSVAYTIPAPSGTNQSRQFRAVVTNSASNTAIQSNSETDTRVYLPTYTSTRNWYVSAAASSANTAGTEASPFNTIQKGADKAAPGDIVYVMAGTYTATSTNIVTLRRTGTPAQQIVFRPYNNDKPVLQLGNNNWGAFGVVPAAAYVTIQGFEMIGNNANVTLLQAYSQPGSCVTPTGTPLAKYNGGGVTIFGQTGTSRPHHIVIANNIIHDCGGGGIGTGGTDYITAENNTIYNTSLYTIYGSSGISFLNSWNSDNSTATKMIIRNNRCYDNKLLVRWNNNGTCKTYDGNGIIVDNNRANNPANPSSIKNPLGDYLGGFLIENNLSYRNGGRGININYTDNATILNNTTYQNGATNTVNSPGTGEVTDDIDNEFIAQGSRNVSVYNNIFYGRPGERVTAVNSSTVVHNNNLTYEGTGTSYFSGGQNITGQDPKFIDAANSNFQLQNTSPALQVGSNVAGQFAATDFRGTVRPQPGPLVSGIDIGAYEMTLLELPVTLSQFTAKPLGNQVSLAWATASERNSAYFEVERSADLSEFGRVGRVEAAGESQTTLHYGLLDTQPLAGTSYYRLKTIDRDGTFDYSKIVSVVLDGVQLSVELLGNPAESGSIRVVTRNMDNAVFELTTATGQALGLTSQPQAGGEFVLLPHRPLAAGVYLLHSRTENSRLIRKVVID